MPEQTDSIVQILNGHTSPETAYVVNDYPYGYRLRCKIRYWLETADKGTRKGKTRLVSQTTNPKAAGIVTVWNKPKCGTYSRYGLVVMCLNGEGHVCHETLNIWTDLDLLNAFKMCPGITDEQKTEIDEIIIDQAIAEKRRAERLAANPI